MQALRPVDISGRQQPVVPCQFPHAFQSRRQSHMWTPFAVAPGTGPENRAGTVQIRNRGPRGSSPNPRDAGRGFTGFCGTRRCQGVEYRGRGDGQEWAGKGAALLRLARDTGLADVKRVIQRPSRIDPAPRPPRGRGPAGQYTRFGPRHSLSLMSQVRACGAQGRVGTGNGRLICAGRTGLHGLHRGINAEPTSSQASAADMPANLGCGVHASWCLPDLVPRAPFHTTCFRRGSFWAPRMPSRCVLVDVDVKITWLTCSTSYKYPHLPSLVAPSCLERVVQSGSRDAGCTFHHMHLHQSRDGEGETPASRVTRVTSSNALSHLHLRLRLPQCLGSKQDSRWCQTRVADDDSGSPNAWKHTFEAPSEGLVFRGRHAPNPAR